MLALTRTGAAAVPAPASRPHARRIGRVVLGGASLTLLMAISAHVSVPLPGTPVPFTLQPLVLFLGAGLLGGVAAASSMAAYVALGIAGMPFFALGGGPAYLAGPTGGFLVGLVPAALVAGSLAARRRSVYAFAAAFVVGAIVLFACGAAHLTLFVGRDFSTVMRAAVLPFVLGDLAKIAVAAAVVAGWRALEARRSRSSE